MRGIGYRSPINAFATIFDASSHHYESVCQSVGPTVGPSVKPLCGQSDHETDRWTDTKTAPFSSFIVICCGETSASTITTQTWI